MVYPFVLGILVLLFCLARGPLDGNGIQRALESPEMQQARAINLLLFSYANDNDQRYPDGKSSTEVFQKLLDEFYTMDPAIFYLPLPGKAKPVPGQKLKPENVCFDVTGGVDATSPDLIPIVFMTGYRVTYGPDGTAVPIIKPYPPFGAEPRTWSEWWHGRPVRQPPGAGIGVAYKSNAAAFIKLADAGSEGKMALHFISISFKADGRTYRQLTPDGVLP